MWYNNITANPDEATVKSGKPKVLTWDSQERKNS